MINFWRIGCGLGLWLALLSVPLARAQEAEVPPEPFRSLTARLQARAAEFPLVAVTSGQEVPKITSVSLNKAPVLFDTGHGFDAVRFRVPAEPGLDLVWAFSVPRTWRHWYILPVTGEPTPGFRNWLNADRAYRDLAGSPESPVALQTLDAKSLEPGREYLLWFCQDKHTTDPAVVSLVIHFAKSPKGGRGWSNKSIVETLRLEAAPTGEQVAYFKSRGGRVLMDPALFHPDDAKAQIDNFLFTVRSTEGMRGGFYVTIETSSPPCRRTPKLSEIIARYGEPDAVLTAAQANALREKSSDTTIMTDRYFFDHFSFETSPADPLGRVQAVSSQYASTAPGGVFSEGLTWRDVRMSATDFRIFYRNRREVARFIQWGKPEVRLVSGAVPVGIFQTSYDNGAPMEKLSYDGKGGWVYASYYRTGPLYRKVTYTDGAYDGVLTDYFEDGRVRVEASYVKGRLHGRLRVWKEDGTVVRNDRFENGERAEDTKE